MSGSLPVNVSFNSLITPALGGVPSGLATLAASSPCALAETAESVDRYVAFGEKQGAGDLFSQHELSWSASALRQFTAARLTWQERAYDRWQAVSEAVVHFSKAAQLLRRAEGEVARIPSRAEQSLYARRRNMVLVGIGVGSCSTIAEMLGEEALTAFAATESPDALLSNEQMYSLRREALPAFINAGLWGEARRVIEFLKARAASAEGRGDPEGMAELAFRMAQADMRDEARRMMRLIVADPERFNEDDNFDHARVFQYLAQAAALIGDRAFVQALPQWIDLSDYLDCARWPLELSLSRAMWSTGSRTEARALLDKVLFETKAYFDAAQDEDAIDEEEASWMDDLVETLGVEGRVSDLFTIADIYQSRMNAFRHLMMYDESTSMVMIARSLARAGLFSRAEAALEEYFMQQEIDNRGFVEVPKEHLHALQSMMMVDYLIAAAGDCHAKAKLAAASLGGIESAEFEQELGRHAVVASSDYLRMIRTLPAGKSIVAEGPDFVRALAGVIDRQDRMNSGKP